MCVSVCVYLSDHSAHLYQLNKDCLLHELCTNKGHYMVETNAIHVFNERHSMYLQVHENTMNAVFLVLQINHMYAGTKRITEL